MLAHTIYRWARSESKSAITLIMLSDLRGVEAMQRFKLMITMFKLFTLKVNKLFTGSGFKLVGNCIWPLSEPRRENYGILFNEIFSTLVVL
jgi:hypothetical protein